MDIATANSVYDVNRIRADFPILKMQVYGKPLVYLDNAASAQKPTTSRSWKSSPMTCSAAMARPQAPSTRSSNSI